MTEVKKLTSDKRSFTGDWEDEYLKSLARELRPHLEKIKQEEDLRRIRGQSDI